jgi:hypothetical protein
MIVGRPRCPLGTVSVPGSALRPLPTITSRDSKLLVVT